MPMLLGLVWLLSEFINTVADVAKRNQYSVAEVLRRIGITYGLFFS
jgi:hypothetical protein